MRILRAIPVLAMMLATLTLTGCATLTGFVTKALFIPANQSGPQIELTGSTDSGFPEYTLPAGRPGTVHLEFPGPYANGTGLGKTCNVEWSRVGTSEVPITTIDKAVAFDYALPGGLNLGQSPVTVTCRVTEGNFAGQDYIARFIMTANYEYVYWTTKNGISRAKISGDEVEITNDFIPKLKGAKSVTTYNDRIYFSSEAGIGRADLDGTKVDKDWLKTPGQAVPTDLSPVYADSDVLVWIDDRQLMSRDFTGGTSRYGIKGIVAFASGGGRNDVIFPADNGTTSLMQDDRFTTDPLGKGRVGGLTIADGAPYWTSDGSVKTLDSSRQVRTVATPASALGEITFDGSRLLTVTTSDDERPLLIRVDRSGEAKDIPVKHPTGGIAAGPGRDPAPRITVEDAQGNLISELSFEYPPSASPTMGQSSEFYLHNRGNAPFRITGGSLTGGSAFMPFIVPGQQVAPGQRHKVQVGFSPPVGGDYSSTLRISGNVNPAGFVEIHFKGRWQADPPRLSLSANSLSFDETTVGSTSNAHTVMVGLAHSWQPITFPANSVTLDGPNKDDFKVTANECQSTVLADHHCDISVTFAPKAPGEKTATLWIASSAHDSPNRVDLTGTAVELGPVFSVSPTQHHFGQAATGFPTDWTIFTVTNTGSTNLEIASGAISLTGKDPDQFDVTPDSCEDATVVPGGTCTFNVLFSPFSVGTKRASVSIVTNASDSPHSVQLTGTGVAPALSFAPNPVPDLDTTAGLPVSGTVTVTNDSAAELPLGAGAVQISGDAVFTITSDGCSGQTLSPTDTCDVQYTFSPTGADTPGMYFADISIAHNGAGNPLSIPVTGVLQP